MLAQLKIKNFAIIDDIEIQFSNQMTVLTGETGSGKSIIIDAINLLLGERASNEMVRFDKDKAIIEGVFYYENPDIDQFLEDNGIVCDDDLLIINREISKNGRNLCRLNGHIVTVNQLKQLGSYLVDVHVQHDTTRLINTNNYLYLIDSFSDQQLNKLLQDYQETYHKYSELVRHYNSIIKENKANKEKLEFYKFQLNEFEQAKISLDQYNELINKRNLIANYDKIYENLNKANTIIKENRVLENIYDSSNYLSKISNINEVDGEIAEQLMNLYYQLDDAANLINDETMGLDYNPNELDQIETRLSVYSQLKRKYKVEVEELIEIRDGLKEKIDQIDNFDYILKDLEKQLIEYHQDTFNKALALRQMRIDISNEIEEKLVKHLEELKLGNTTFQIIFNEIEETDDFLNASMYNELGFDEVDFKVSFNKGEPTKPISKVASGGELSRFMLALKTILTEKQKLSTIVFDEIDTGVSGVTANAIALKIKSISKNTQVLCITHLPQVASIADHHLFIYKVEKENRTNTFVKNLTEEERITEIAKMIAGDTISDYAIENAKNLLNIIK